MAVLETAIAMETGDRKQGSVVTPSDFILQVVGFEHLIYNTKTFSIPVLKNDKIEYVTAHGLKMEDSGMIQTLNNLPATLQERGDKSSGLSIEGIIASGLNGELVINIYSGRDLRKAKLWGVLHSASFFVEDNPEADAEATTSALTFNINISGHYVPTPPVEVDLLALLG